MGPREPGRAVLVELALKIARTSPTVLALGKRAFYEQEGIDERAAYGLACAVMVDNALLDDAHEGMHAFLEKRKPEWPKT
jgi:enoyl-CoA hydratase/carnithine racemase